MAIQGSIALALSRRKVLHRWDERSNSYGCGAVEFVERYTPPFRTAIVADTSEVPELQVPSPDEVERLKGEGYRFCGNCFRGMK